MTFYQRILTIDLPKKQSAFLWGARKTGKSTFLKQQFPNSIYYDFLRSEQFMKFSKFPNVFREEILALREEKLSYPIIIDEVQRIPSVLNEIHWLIENTNASFILCGSSARKLKRADVNLLGGRAWKYHFYPLVFKEIKDFFLLKVLNNGTIPAHYLSRNSYKSLQAYVEDYLTQEIQAEGLVRNLPAFARFLDSMSFSNGEMTNYANIARDCGVDAKTVKEYYQILVDTLTGYYVYPYTRGSRKDIITSVPKFYLFDVGVAGFLSKRKISHLEGPEAGKSLENYILQELVAFKNIEEHNFDILYWRTKTGLEVDFILSNEQIGIEVKISNNVHVTDLKGIKAAIEEGIVDIAYLVCLEERRRKITHKGKDIFIIPVEDFLESLWSGNIVKAMNSK